MKNPRKNDSIEFGKQNKNKQKQDKKKTKQTNKQKNGNQILNQQIAKMEIVKVVKNLKVIKMNLSIVTVIIKICKWQ